MNLKLIKYISKTNIHLFETRFKVGRTHYASMYLKYYKNAKFVYIL